MHSKIFKEFTLSLPQYFSSSHGIETLQPCDWLIQFPDKTTRCFFMCTTPWNPPHFCWTPLHYTLMCMIHTRSSCNTLSKKLQLCASCWHRLLLWATWAEIKWMKPLFWAPADRFSFSFDKCWPAIIWITLTAAKLLRFFLESTQILEWDLLMY